MTATVTLSAPDDDGWRELRVGDHRYRFREEGKEHAHFAAGLQIEYHGYGEWRAVRNWNSRDWFTLGLLAGREEAKDG